MSQIILENDVARLLDDGTFYVVEDKTQLNRQVVEQKHTETLKSLWVDWAFTENGKRVAVRYYFPKTDFEVVLAKNVFRTLSRAREKEIVKLKDLHLGGLV